MYSDVPVVFVDTGLEYPELRKFAIELADEVLKPKMKFTEVITKYGYPIISKEVSNTISGARNSIKKGVYSHRLCKLGVSRDEYGGLYDNKKFNYDDSLNKSKFKQNKWRFLLDMDFNISHYCCEVMKKNPIRKYEKSTNRKPFIGTMTIESQNRWSAWIKNGCNAFNAKYPSSQPLSFWTDQDILQYIIKYNLSYASVYGKIQQDENGNYYCTQCDRTGCVFCAFGVHLEKEPNRFQRLKTTHPKLYNYCIYGGHYEEGIWVPNKEGLGMGHVLDEIGVNYRS